MRLSWILVLAPLAVTACGGTDVVVANPPQAATAPASTVVVPAPAAPPSTVVVPAPAQRSERTIVVPR